ncbi:acetyl-CoA synthetase-like protein [Phlegmacium glaucopus]|nr:acetyl-CoA synthetase-like protein [Phlegmacium glaucopus]
MTLAGRAVSTPGLTPLPSEPVLIPRLIDFRAQHDAQRVCLSYPAPTTSKYIDITFEDFGRAVNNAAWEFCKIIGARRSSSEPTKVVGILARSNAAYMVSIYALHKCGIAPLLISPRNSREAIVHLLKSTNSAALITDSFNKAEAEASAAELGSLPVYDIAPLPTPGIPASEPFPFNLQWEEECDKPAIFLHTSGSTGLPKPVAWNSLFIFHQGFYPPEFVAKYNGSSVLATLPLFHGSGAALTRASLIWLGWRVVFPDSTKPVTASYLVDFCKGQYAPDVVIGAPSVIEEVAMIEGGMDVMRGRRFWFFVGAPVPPQLGDFLVKEKIHFLSMLGSTEIGQMNVLEPEGRAPEDWQYHQLRPDLDIVLEPRGSEPGEGPFELIVLAKDGWKPGTINVNIEGVEGYSTSDLYQKHHSHPRLFKHCGRADDVIVLANGEKTLSRPIEVPIEAHPRVTAAVVFGTGRTQNGILVEPAASYVFDPSDEPLLVAFRNEIWPAVQKANASSPSHSQIWKEMILVTSPNKSLPRTDKGSVRRKPAIQLYSAEIDELYLTVESFTSNRKLPTTLDAENLAPFFQGIVNEALNKPVGVDDDVFALGMDSLKAIFIRNSLLSSLRGDERTVSLVSEVPQNFVFLFTTPRAMADAAANLVKTGRVVAEDDESAHASMIDEMVQKYTASFPTHTPGAVVNDEVGEVVILTGSTGSLGSFILDTLIHEKRVQKVFCFNRHGSTPTLARQQASFDERKLDSALLSRLAANGHVVFLDVEINAPFFGLAEDIFKGVHNSATLVIHNAWALNFNWQLNTFENVHIAGLRNIIDFALTSPRPTPPRVAFTSSIASAGAYTSGPVPEQPINDPGICLTQGYARSKFVGERILAIAAEKTGLQTLSFRIGQISGDTKHGIWNVTDHVPVLFKGCQKLGAIPHDWLPVVAWVSVDDVAHTIVDVVLDKEQGKGTFHVSSPQPTPWKELMPAVKDMLVTRINKELEVVSMKEWIEKLKTSTQSAEDNPAIKLITFFENNMTGKGIRCRLAIDKTKTVSPSLTHVKPVDESAIRLFVDYWRGVGYLQ